MKSQVVLILQGTGLVIRTELVTSRPASKQRARDLTFFAPHGSFLMRPGSIDSYCVLGPEFCGRPGVIFRPAIAPRGRLTWSTANGYCVRYAKGLSTSLDDRHGTSAVLRRADRRRFRRAFGKKGAVGGSTPVWKFPRAWIRLRKPLTVEAWVTSTETAGGDHRSGGRPMVSH